MVQADTNDLAMRWYVINTVPSHENKVRQTILEKVEELGLGEVVEEVMIPLISVKAYKRGKMVIADRNLMPGYVFIRMYLNEAVFSLIRGVPSVINFLGQGRKPKPIPDSEVAEIRSQIVKSEERDIEEGLFRAGDVVKIFSGPFATFSGMVQDVDTAKANLNVLVSIFGRETPIKLAFNEVEKIS